MTYSLRQSTFKDERTSVQFPDNTNPQQQEENNNRRRRIKIAVIAATVLIVLIAVIGTVTAVLVKPDNTNAQVAPMWWLSNDYNGIAVRTDNYNILKTLDHDRTAFTQGLYYHNDTGQMVESTGQYGQSLVRIWDPITGQVLHQTPILDSKYFGEGLTWYQDENGEDRYIQITWKKRTAFVYDTTDLTLLNTFQYTTVYNEGWGITFDPIEKVFYVSDGSAFLHVWDLQFQELRKFRVTQQDSLEQELSSVDDINELEWDPNTKTILANIWYQDIIMRIWPETGQVVQVYDFAALDSGNGGNVLNGIAYHSPGVWWITGKLWQHLYLIDFLE